MRKIPNEQVSSIHLLAESQTLNTRVMGVLEPIYLTSGVRCTDFTLTFTTVSYLE